MIRFKRRECKNCMLWIGKYQEILDNCVEKDKEIGQLRKSLIMYQSRSNADSYKFYQDRIAVLEKQLKNANHAKDFNDLVSKSAWENTYKLERLTTEQELKIEELEKQLAEANYNLQESQCDRRVLSEQLRKTKFATGPVAVKASELYAGIQRLEKQNAELKNSKCSADEHVVIKKCMGNDIPVPLSTNLIWEICEERDELKAELNALKSDIVLQMAADNPVVSIKAASNIIALNETYRRQIKELKSEVERLKAHIKTPRKL